MKWLPDIISMTILVLVLLGTCFLSQQRGLEASSIQAQINHLQAQIDELRPVPRINVQRASIYPISGEVVVDVVQKGEP